jgi:hypothetical protein
MGDPIWDGLTSIERALLINAMEMDIFPGFIGDLDDDEQDMSQAELAEIVLSLVDKGWFTVHRYEPWISPEGNNGIAPGAQIPRHELSALLADPTTWEYFDRDPSWVGAVTLVEAEAGKKLSRFSPEELAERDAARAAHAAASTEDQRSTTA